MSDADSLSLADGERVLWDGHPRIMTVLPAVIAGFVVVVASVAVAVRVGQPVLVLLALGGLAIPVWSYLHVANTRYVVTDRALYRKTGVLSRRVQRVSLSNVQNSQFSQGIRGSFLGYGSVAIEAAGGGSVRFGNIENPRDVRTLVDERAGEDPIRGSVEQWRAILNEVQALRDAVVGRS